MIIVAWAARSSNLLAGAGRPVPVRPLIPMTAFANTINNVTPGSAGELVRLYLLRAQHGVDYTTGAAIVLIERVVAIVLLGASAASPVADLRAGPPAGRRRRSPSSRSRSPRASSTGRASVRRHSSAGCRSGDWSATPAGRPPEAPSTGSTSRWRPCSTDPPRAIAFAGWTARACSSSYTAQLLLVAAAIGQPLDPAAAWGALGLGIIVGVLSLLPFGLGSADLVVAGLLVVAGVPGREAVAITFGYRLVSTLPLGLLGVASYALLSARLPHGHASEAASAASAALAAAAPRDR